MLALRAALPDGEHAADIVLIAGEPGSGKSRLVRELAASAADTGVRVLYGACDSDVAVPYGPFAAISEQLGVDAPDGAADALAPLSGGPAPGGGGGDPDAERLRLQRAFGDVLGAAATRTPLMMVVEDAHWADAASIAMLRRLAKTPPSDRLLVVVTYRDASSDIGPELAGALAELRRSEAALHLRLAGLTADDVARWVRETTGIGAAAELATLPDQLGALTGGNPFLLGEVWRALVETGVVVVEGGTVDVVGELSDVASPQSVRDVVAGRLARLDPATRAMLEMAAVAGPGFRVDVIELALGQPTPGGLAGMLDDAEAHGTIEAAAGGAYRFTHELVRRAVVDRLPSARRAELHLRVAEALEGLGAAGTADLAHHFGRAAAAGGRERALLHGLAAARSAAAASAHDAAVAHLARVLSLDPASEVRGELMLELGAEQIRAGDEGGAIHTFRASADLARELSDTQMLGRAAVGLEEACFRPGIVDAGAVELLGEAERALPADHSGPGASVRTSLARALAYRGQHDDARRIVERAVDEAREIGDDRVLARALIATFFASAGRPGMGIVDALSEAHALGEQMGDRELAIEAAMWRVVALTRVGRTAQARTELDELRRAAAAAGLPFVLHVAEQHEAALALAEGRLADADAAAERSREWGESLRGRDVRGAYGIQMFGIRREQGRLGELAPVARVLAASQGGSAWRPGLIALLVETGFEDEARVRLSGLVDDGLPGLDGEGLSIAGLVYLCDAARALGDRRAATALRPALAPRSGQVLVVSMLVACLGAADRALGLLDETLGDLDSAVEHLERGVEVDGALGLRTWEAWGRHALARVLRARAHPGDAERAAALQAGTLRTAESLGLVALVEEARPPAAAVVAPDDLTPRELVVLSLIVNGRSNREIGVELVISEHTVANHVRSILRKTGSANRTEAARYAHRRGLVDGG